MTNSGSLASICLKLAAPALTAALLLGASQAQASTASVVGYDVSYDVSYPGDASTPTLSNIVMWQQWGPNAFGFDGEFTWGYTVFGGGTHIDPPGGVLGFGPSLFPVPAISGMVFGVTTDPDSVQHLVLSLDPAAAAYASGHSWDEVFPTSDQYPYYSEAEVLGAVLRLTDYSQCADASNCNDSLALLGVFMLPGGELSHVTDSTGGSPPVEGQFAVPGSFDLVSFSSGNIIAHGTSSLTPILGPPTGGVPEPSTYAMLILGFGGLGALLRSARSRRASALA